MLVSRDDIVAGQVFVYVAEDYVFHHLVTKTGERNWSVVYRAGFGVLFVHCRDKGC